MAKQISLIKLTLVYTAGNLLSQIIRFILFFAFAFYLSQESIGFYDLIITSVSLLTPLATLQIADAIMRWGLNNREENHLKKVITNSIFIFLTNALILTPVFFAASYYYSIQYSLLLYAFTILQSVYVMLLQFARGVGKNITYISGDIICSVVFAIFVILFAALWPLEIKSLLIANILALILTIFILFVKLKILKYISLKDFNYSFSRKMLNYSLPLIPNTISWWAISSINKFIILTYLGIASTGLFAVSLKISSVLLLFTNIFNTAWQEKVISLYSTNNRNNYFSLVFEKFLIFLFSLIILFTASSKPALKYLMPQDYYEAWRLLPIIYLAIGFQALSLFLGSGYLSAKNTKGVFVTTLIGAITTIFLSFLLTPLVGLTGSCFALLLGFFIIFMIRLVQTKKYFNMLFPLKKIFLLAGLFITACLLSLFENKIVWILNLLYSISIVIFLNKKGLHSFQETLKGSLKQTII